MTSITPPRTALLLECSVCCRTYTAAAGYLIEHEPGAIVCPHCGAHHYTSSTFEPTGATVTPNRTAIPGADC
jgi:hypothetical protein